MSEDVTVVLIEQPGAAVEVLEGTPPVVQTLDVPSPVVVVQAFSTSTPPASLDVRSLVAAAALGGHRAVYAAGGGTVDHASSANAAHLGKVVGITIGAATMGALAEVATSGEMTEPSFTFVPGPVYFNSSGVLTQTPPVTGFLQQVAVAVSATKIIVGLGMPIAIN
jgi:hypothetical protein